MMSENLNNDRIKAEINKLEAKNGLRQRYLNWYIKNGNLSAFAFQTAIARDELNIVKLREQLV